jgi:hypothetical protein
LAADSSAVVALWSSFVQGSSPPLAPRSATSSAASNAPITPEDRFRLRADGSVYVQTAENGTRLSMTIGPHKRTEAVGGAMYFVQRAIAAREFAASESLAWGENETRLGWTDVEQVLAHLVNEGLLERVTR